MLTVMDCVVPHGNCTVHTYVPHGLINGETHTDMDTNLAWHQGLSVSIDQTASYTSIICLSAAFRLQQNKLNKSEKWHEMQFTNLFLFCY